MVGHVARMMNHTHQLVLRTLFEMASEDIAADLPSLAARIGVSCGRALRWLDQLDRAGLVDADRVRLTMRGLVLATVSRPALRAIRAA